MDELNTRQGQKQRAKSDSPDSVLPKDRRIKLIQGLGTVFIIIGILGILLPFFNAYLIARNSNIDLSAITAEDMRANLQGSEGVPFDSIKEIGYFDFWPLLGKWREDSIIGELIIPSLDLHLALFNSASNENLLAGVGQLFADRKFGDPNFVLTGHHVQGNGVLLNRLMDAEIGKTIYISNKENVFIYRIVDAVQKDVDAVHMLDSARNEFYNVDSIVSIMTCYQGKVSSRWFVIAALEDIVPYTEQVLQTEYNFVD